jgi:hypothetical protein
MKLRTLVHIASLFVGACGPTPVAGTWQAVGLNVQGFSVDVTYSFTAQTMSTKTVTYSGSTADVTTNLTGTYTWDSKADGTHVLTSYSSMNISSVEGDVSVLNTVCVDQGNCDGFQFTLPQASQSSCLCKRQELVFQSSGSNMVSSYNGTAATFRPPQ